MKNVYLLSILLILVMGCKQPADRESFIIDDKQLVPEGIAWSAKTGKFYLTSLAKSKIIEVDGKTLVQKDFIGEGEYGFMPGVGIYADDARNRLLALSGYYLKEKSGTSLFDFDLESGELKNVYAVQDTGYHFLNDLVVTGAGDIYMTDTRGSAVYLLKNNADSLIRWMHTDEIMYPNGIAISDDNAILYIASHVTGVRAVDLQTKEFLNQADTTGMSNGIDGLELFDGNLYAVQNGVRKNDNNFRKLLLNETGTRITGMEVLDSGKVNLGLPLTFCIAGDDAVVITHSNLQYLNQQDYSFPTPDSLRNTRLKVYELKSGGADSDPRI